MSKIIHLHKCESWCKNLKSGSDVSDSSHWGSPKCIRTGLYLHVNTGRNWYEISFKEFCPFKKLQKKKVKNKNANI